MAVDVEIVQLQIYCMSYLKGSVDDFIIIIMAEELSLSYYLPIAGGRIIYIYIYIYGCVCVCVCCQKKVLCLTQKEDPQINIFVVATHYLFL